MYLDPNDVEDCFAFDLFTCAPHVEKTHEFADYILQNYIDENSKFSHLLFGRNQTYNLK
jgi:hypothetical protein